MPKTIQFPPGTLLTLPAAQADALLARYGGDEVDPATGEVTRTVKPARRAVNPERATVARSRAVVRSDYMRR